MTVWRAYLAMNRAHLQSGRQLIEAGHHKTIWQLAWHLYTTNILLCTLYSVHCMYHVHNELIACHTYGSLAVQYDYVTAEHAMLTSYWRICGESVWRQALKFLHTHIHARVMPASVCVCWGCGAGQGLERWLSKFLLLFICFACAFAAEQTIRNNVDFLQLSLEMSKCQSGSK